jgi:hypothetical protein
MTAVSGGIETRPHPVGIGTCNGKDGFKGLLDDVSMFLYQLKMHNSSIVLCFDIPYI